MKLTRKPGLWSRVLCVTALLLAGSGCRSRQGPEEASVRVEAGPATARDVEVMLRYPIELEAAEKVAVSPVAVTGFLTSVLVDVGDKVRAGQVIAMVDCREYAAQLTQAETAISRWQAQEEESRAQLGRLVAMDESKLVAPAELDRAKATHRVSEAQLADARAKLSEATQRQGYCWLKSPFDGYVSERTLDPGAMVGPGGQPVVTIVKTRDVKVVASVTEQDAPKVQRGAEVDIVLHAFPDTPFRGTVARLGRSLDPKTRTLTVEVDVANAQEMLLPGMTGRAAIVVGKRDKALLLPITALLNLEDASYVYVVRKKDGKPRAERVAVKLGVDLGDWLEITEGIAPDDHVIMVGRELVTDGTLVEVKPPVIRPPAVQRKEKPTPEPRVSSLVPEEPTDEDSAKKDSKPGTTPEATPPKSRASSVPAQAGAAKTAAPKPDAAKPEAPKAEPPKAEDPKAEPPKAPTPQGPKPPQPPPTPAATPAVPGATPAAGAASP